MDMITAQQAAEAAKGMTFETVWAALMESRQRMDESYEQTQKQIEESQRKMRESYEQTQKRIEDIQQETRKIVSDLSKNIGGLNNTIGEFTESMFSPDLWKKFDEYGILVTEQSKRRTFRNGNIKLAEVDVYIENGDYAIPVEVKTKLSEEDVDKHIERIKIIRGYLDAKGDKRKLLGAVAGGVVADKVLQYAQEKGLFVIVQSGNSATIAETPEGFKPREW